MAILNRLSEEELNSRLTSMNSFNDEDEFGELIELGLNVYRYTDKINFSAENMFAPIKFVIDYEVFKHGFNECMIISVKSEFYIDGQHISTDTIYHSSLESCKMKNLNKVYDEIECMFSEIRHLLKLKKKNYNIGNSVLRCAASIYRYELLCDSEDKNEFPE
jgi:hypothetical protein